MERFRQFHFFFYKKNFFGFFKILAMKITLDFFFKFVLVCEFHLDKFHFLVGIFRRFLWLRHQKPQKHKKWYICFIFWVRTIIFGVEVVLGWTNMCAKFQLYRLISKRAMKFWNIENFEFLSFFQKRNFFQKIFSPIFIFCLCV